jgi:hypothetical protein
VDAHRLVALISYPEGADPGEITTSYMASAKFAACIEKEETLWPQ